VVTNIIDKLEHHFGKMTVTRGREHTFLGMNIHYTEEQTAKITMKQYLEEALQDSTMTITYQAATPARKNLFTVDESAAKLSKVHADTFHSVNQKLLYVAIRGRMDLLLPVGFLGTRVSKPTIEDWGKLKRVLEYVKGTMDLVYTIGADNLTTVRTWVDASFAVHPDMKSHTGGLISYGRGGLLCKSNKQKTTQRSSTHAEMVGVSDYLPNTVWAMRFMEEQGYPALENYLEQDNESAIKLEVNGRTSAGAKSRHLDIRYFWIKETLDTLKIKVRHCRTLKMLADFFTKPLQGSLFKIFRDIILGSVSIDYLDLVIDTGLDTLAEERVEEMRQFGRGTDDKENETDPDPDSNENETDRDPDDFILVTGKRNRRKVYWDSSVLLREQTRGDNAK
jgi:hypothetical protein